jgi:hypothetical protein
MRHSHNSYTLVEKYSSINRFVSSMEHISIARSCNIRKNRCFWGGPGYRDEMADGRDASEVVLGDGPRG